MMGTRNSLKKNFTQKKISHDFNPPCMHEKICKNGIVHQKNIANAKKLIISPFFPHKLLKASKDKRIDKDVHCQYCLTRYFLFFIGFCSGVFICNKNFHD